MRVLRIALGGAALVASAAMAQACTFSADRGWASNAAGGTAQMAMTRGEPCTGVLYSDPNNTIKVTAIAVVSPPKHGSIAAAGGTFVYTPSTGYVGVDQFALTASGKIKDGSDVKLKGIVSVSVKP